MNTEPIHVLLIEDNPGDARLIREMLSEAQMVPFALECAERLSDGLARLSAGGIDAVLLDLSLPDSQGADTFARLHAHAPRAPIVVMTGHEDEALGVQLVEAGAQEYLVKGQVTSLLLTRAIRYAIERQRGAEALHYERNKLVSILEAMEDGVYIVDQQYNIEYLNPILLKEFGPIEGRKCYTYFHDRTEICPWCPNQEVFAGKTVHWEWYSFKNQKTYDLIDAPLRNPDGTLSKLEIFRDITERKRAEEALARRTRELTALYAIDRAAAQTLDLNEILDDSLDKVLEVLEVEAGGILLLEPDGEMLRLRVHRGLSNEFVQNVNVVKVGEGLAGRAAVERKPVTMDVAQYPLERLAPFIVKEGLQSLASVPLVAKDRVLGALTLGTRRPRVFTKDQIDFLTSVGQQLGGAVANALLFQETREAREAVLNMLEDLDKTARQVQASEEQYRTLVENATELIWTHDTEGRFTFANRQAEQVSGYKLADWIGKSFAPIIVPEDLPRVQQIFLEVLGGKAQSYEARTYRADGSRLYLSVNTTPLYREGKIVGTISFARDVTEEERLRRETEQHFAELSALFTVSSALREAATVEEMLPIILDKTVEVLRADTGALFRLDRHTQELVAKVARGRLEQVLGLRLGFDEGVCGYVAQTCTPYSFTDLAADPHTGARIQPLVQGVQGGVCVPLMTGEHLVGTLIAGSEAPRTFTDNEIRVLTAIADMAASAIHRASLFEELEHRVHELSALYGVGKMVTATLRLEDVLDFVVGAATRTIHTEGCYLFLWDEREERLIMRAVQGFPPELVGRTKYRLGEGFSGWVFLEGRMVSVPDVVADPRWKAEPDQETPLPSGRIISALVVPLKVGEKTLGVLGVVNKTVDRRPLTAEGVQAAVGGPPSVVGFSESDESLLTALAGQMAIAIENAHLYEDVRGLSVATIRSLATAIDARDPYTRGHSEDVTRLAVPLAREMGWSGADLEMLEFAALLHDVGKIAVPDAILRKVESLTPEDWNIIRMHPYHSAQMIKPVEPLQRIVPWVYHSRCKTNVHYQRD